MLSTLDLPPKLIYPVVKHFFNHEYEHAALLVSSIGDVSSPALDGMPHGTARDDAMTTQMLRTAEAQTLIKKTTAALDALPDSEAEVLVRRFDKHETETKTSIKMAISTRSVERLLSKACTDFAYAFDGGKLLDNIN